MVSADAAPGASPVSLTEIEYRVLRHIRVNPGRSRTEIAADLGLSKSMLTKAVAKFDAARLVVEEHTTLQDGGRGKPPIRLSLRHDACHSVGVYVDRQVFTAVRTDLGGTVLRTVRRPLAALRDDDLVALILADLQDLVAGSPVPVLGVGHAVPAMVDDRGTLFEVTPTQASLPLAAIARAVRSRLALPVYWENDAFCVAAYEANGPHAERHCVFYLSLGFGVGGGMAVDGTVFRGAYNQAANIGALIPETGPRPSLPDLARHLGRPMADLSDEVLTGLMRAADPGLLAWIDDRGRRLSWPLAAAVQFLNPDAMVVGGFFPAEVLAALCARIDLGVHDIPARRPLTKPALSVASLRGPAGIAEAAALMPIAARLLGQRILTAAPR